MRKFSVILLTIIMFLIFTSCNGNKKIDEIVNSSSQIQSPTQPTSSQSSSQQTSSTGDFFEKPATADPTVDIDLTQLSSTMVYSQVYDMVTDSEKYVGKTVKIKGQFTVIQNPETKQNYFVCIVLDATACCAEGLEFITTKQLTYPEDYPAEESEITIIGTYTTAMEDGFQVYRLVNAEIL